MATERPRRSTRNRKKKPPPPNPALYVGYVNDFETPEMIMKKFEVLEKIQKENEKILEQKNEEIDKKRGIKSGKCEVSDEDSDMDDNDNNNNNNKNDNNMRNGLTDDQLMKMYTETNYFTTKSAQTGNAVFYEKPIMDKDGFVMGYDSNDVSDYAEMADYDADEMYGNENDDIYCYKGSDYESDDDDDNKTKNKRGGKSRKRGFRGHNNIDFGSALISRNNLNFNAVYIKKCCDKVVQEIPNYPIPISWMNAIKPYNHNIGSLLYTYKECDIFKMKEYINELNFDEKQDAFHGILMDPCFDTSDEKYFYNHDGLFTVDEFNKYITKDLMYKLCPKGMLFVYIESQLINDVITIIESWNFKFVEHAAWVYKKPNNKIALFERYGISKSKKNLFLFRRAKEKIELRHQRTSDTMADFLKYHPETGQLINSDYQYKIIETLLPNSIKHVKAHKEGKKLLKNNDKQRLLYMWAPKDEKRDGWTVLCDPRVAKIDTSEAPHLNNINNKNNKNDVVGNIDDDIDLKQDQ